MTKIKDLPKHKRPREKLFEKGAVGYFVFANADKNLPKFDGKLQFKLSILDHKGDDSWVEPAILKIKKVLDSDSIPSAGEDCEHCEYRKLIKNKE